MACAAVAAACVLPASSVAGDAPARYRDPAGDAGAAPDIATVTMTQMDAGTLAVSIVLAQPTDLGRSGWIIMGIDTDRNPHSGGMHGSEAIVLANGERAVLLRRIGGHFRPTEHAIHAHLTGDELAFTLQLADLRARAFDFAVATLRQNADVAPDRGVFAYPGPAAER
jgi:hypothetical protein